MLVAQEIIRVATKGLALYDITKDVANVVSRSKVKTGLATIFIQHTSASLLIQENAAPSVRSDLQTWMAQIAPEGSHYEHDDEGPDDMPAHLRSAITRTSESIPIGDGRLMLGTWQALYLWEHRRASHTRSIVVHVAGV
jgi:secondary thiamine-phosphate synthase enzyme